MLCLTRRVNERVMINGGEIVVKVLSIRGQQVKLGFQAPWSMSIHREEIEERISAQAPGSRKRVER